MPCEEGSWDGTSGGVEHLILSPSNHSLVGEHCTEAEREHEEVVDQHQPSSHRGVPSDGDP